MLVVKWWPDGSKILVFDLGAVSEIFGSPMDTTSDVYGIFEVSANPDLIIKNYNLSTDVMGSFKSGHLEMYDISPDGRLMVCAKLEKNTKGGFDPKLKFLNLETITLTDASGFTFSNKRGSDVRWIP
jgi:hypothetical protein